MQKQRDDFLVSLCRQGLEDGVYGSVGAVVGYRKENTWKKIVAYCGSTRSDTGGRPVEASTFFDLASLTKPLCTALGFVHLAGKKKVDLNQSVSSLVCCRDFPAHWQNISLVDLLSHSSGLPAYREYYRKWDPAPVPDGREALLRLIVREKPEYSRQTRCLYSDLGYMVLGSILEEVAGRSLEDFFRERVADPCGLGDVIGFWPLASGPGKRTVAATELCPWRKRLLIGEVHDEHAWLMGGLGGHAGLFGTAEAVAALCMLLVDIWQQRGQHPSLDGHILRQALAYTTKAGLWALGFDRPTPGQSSSGDFFSPASFGHLGYTGTSFWMDMEREKIVVLLTNRVHPSRENKKIQQFRPFFHNQIMREWDCHR